VPTDLDDLLIALYVLADEFLPKRDPSRPGRKPRIADAEVLCLAAAQVLLDCAKERRSCALSSTGSATSSPTCASRHRASWPCSDTWRVSRPPGATTCG
jgi:hypothetical protein